VDFPPTTSSELQLFTKVSCDLVWDLGLPKDCTEILGSRLQSKNLLTFPRYIIFVVPKSWQRVHPILCPWWFSGLLQWYFWVNM
jgi:hypothetical protein